MDFAKSGASIGEVNARRKAAHLCNIQCPLYDKKCDLHVKDYQSDEKVDWLIVCDSPSKDDYRSRKSLVGPTGKFFKAFIEEAREYHKKKFGYKPTYYVTNVVACYTQDFDGILPYCYDRLLHLIDKIKPSRIFSFGAKALHVFTGQKLSIADLFGAYSEIDVFEDEYNVEYFMHPSNMLRNKALIPYWKQMSLYTILNTPRADWIPYWHCKVNYCYELTGAINTIKMYRRNAAERADFHGKYLIGYDTEFNGANKRGLCCSLCAHDDIATAFPEEIFNDYRFLQALYGLFTDENVVVCAHSWKADAHISTHLGLPKDCFEKAAMVDSMTMRNILNPELKASLAVCEYAVGLGGHKEVFHSKLKSKTGEGYEKLYDEDPELTMWYCALDTLASYRLAFLYDDMLEKFNLSSAYYDLYHKLDVALFNVELVGVQVDKSVHSSLEGFLSESIEKQESIILSDRVVQKVAKSSDKIKDGIFNISSAYHMRELLFDNPNGYKKKPEKKTTKGSACTDKYVVKSYSGKIDIVDNILEYNRLSTVYNTYVKGWKERWDDAYKLHTSYRIVRTGRLSSSNPNLQNIPRPVDYESKLLRSCLVSPLDDFVIGEVDFGQAELRQMAQESGDAELIKAYMHRVDIHKKTAAFVSGCSINAVTKAQRQAAKCFHPDTEVMTRDGWKRIIDLSHNEEVLQAVLVDKEKPKLEWIVPKQVYSMDNEYDHLYHLKNEGIDIRVTPDHYMLKITNGGNYNKVLPEDFNGVRYWPNAGLYDGVITIPEDVLRFAVAVQADGSITENAAVRFGFSKMRKVERLHKLLKRLNIEYTYKEQKNGVKRFYIKRKYAKDATALLDNKMLPYWWKDLSLACKEIVLDEAVHWDGCKLDTWAAYQYFSAKKQNIDVMQMIATTAGRKTAIKEYATDGCYKLTIRSNWKSRGGNVSIEKIPYTGKVACLAVDSGVVLVRDGARKIPIITKQSFNFGLAFGMSEYRLQDYAKNDYGVELTLEESKGAKKKYFKLYKGIRRFQIRTILQASKDGCVWVNWVGNPYRVRWLPGIGSTNKRERGSAERQAINTKIQGGAQEYTLRGIISIYDLLINNKLPGVIALTGTVHDSILFLVHKDMIQEACEAIGCVLVSQPTIKDVPLEVDFKYGPSLGDMVEGITINSLDNPKYPDVPKSHFIYGQYKL